MSVQVTIPLEWENLAIKNIGYTAGIETTMASHTWIEKGNHMDNIIVVSTHSKQTFADIHYDAINTQTNEPVKLKLTTPVKVANYPVKSYENIEELDLPLDYDFNFLAIAQFGPRKNLHNTIKWFVEEFYNDEVGLVVKSNIAKNCLLDRSRLSADLNRMMQPYSDKKCKVYLIHGDMTDAEIHSLYAHPKVKAFLALPHGEGFGLPIFEAAYSGIPVVATGWSGQLDFLVDETGMEQFYNVAFDLNTVQENVVWENVIIKESMWAYPRESSAKEQMRKCYEEVKDSPRNFEYANALKDRFSEEKMYSKFVDLVIASAPQQTIVNDMDEIEKLFAEASL